MSTDPTTRVIRRMPTANGRSKTAKLWHDESVLRKLYEQDGRTQKQIADLAQAERAFWTDEARRKTASIIASYDGPAAATPRDRVPGEQLR